MKLSIPFNWRNDFLESIPRDSVSSIYGRLHLDAAGSGSGSVLAFDGSRKEMAEYVAKINKSGYRFNYIFDGTCCDNLEWTRKWQENVRCFLDWLVKTQVSSITISIPYLAEIIKKCYHTLGVEVSHCAQVDTLLRAKRWNDLGVDVITLAPDAVSGNFELIMSIKKALRCQLQLVANEFYLSQSTSYSAYSNRSSHLTQEFNQIGSHRMLRKEGQMNLMFGDNDINQHIWIKPDEVAAYEEVGIERIKLFENSLNTDAIFKMIGSYLSLAN